MTGFKAVVIGDLIDHDASKVQGTAYFDKSSTPAQREAFTEMPGVHVRLESATHSWKQSRIHRFQGIAR